MRIFSSPPRLAAVLLMVHPVMRTAEEVSHVIRAGLPFYAWYGNYLILLVLCGTASAGLWRARRWAYGFGMAMGAFSAGSLSMILVALYAVENPGSGYTLRVLGMMIAIVCGAGVVLLLASRQGRAAFAGLEPARSRARLVAATVLAEIALMGAVAIWGLELDFHGPWYSQLLGALHLPGVALLIQTGWCCYTSSLIIADVATHPWGGITPHGLPMVMYANMIGLLPLAVLIRGIARGVRARRAAANLAAAAG